MALITEVVLIWLIIASATVAVAYMAWRYHEHRNTLEYKQARLEYDELLVSDGGEDDPIPEEDQ